MLSAAKMCRPFEGRAELFGMVLFAFLRKVSERKTEMSSLLTPRYAAPESGEAYQLRANPLRCVFPVFYPKSFWGVRGIFSKIPLSP